MLFEILLKAGVLGTLMIRAAGSPSSREPFDVTLCLFLGFLTISLTFLHKKKNLFAEELHLDY